MAQRPKLVVGIVVDQMRQEYLQRFESKFSEDGFKRLQREGFEVRNNHYNYIPTYTAPGHASIYTGTTPKYHGVIGNNWYSRPLGRSVYCAGDTTVEAVGGSARNGFISPRNMVANTITDELKLTLNFKSKVIGVSIKDRGAALPAGHAPDGAYWYDSRTGEFMTSTFYFDELPKWVQQFNKRKLVDKYLNQVWEPVLPLEEYTESTPDNVPYERGFKGKDTPTFPYDLAKLRTKNGPYSLISSTPFGNSLVKDMALAAMKAEEMGRDEITDFLAVSFSSTDYVGHNFGPNSIELEDTYLRLDQDLAELLNELDEQVGKGEYLVFLTADHGVVANPQFLLDYNLPGGYFSAKTVEQELKEAVKSKYGQNFVLDFSNTQVFLDRPEISAAGLDLREVQEFVVEVLMESSFIAEAFPAYDLQHYDYEDPLRKLLFNGYNRQRSGDVLLVMNPGYLSDDYGTKGTSHGSGFTYDTHVPLLFFGKGVKAGSTVSPTYITDIAPTLAMLLNISMPNAAVSGEPIKELFE
ncbi:putative AlkP superfamily pyrophosphatase or phosphodiesterase [Marinoscillum furvescens DSM 4134]|uniref:Putative AlkP superfamily pyrophosphatase or phosphodiesterase n=2 Tax=Marinoscillum furvescens TaxID=1026 RepID=A0A3D9L4C6_MARFU|nr:putative AlkP superfamily pyrophosphatase or phosphodiesterase [Marinoscillum furvescens DSM 4134]